VLGAEAVWLLTTTAADYFAAFGFVPVERAAVPEPIRESAEFASLCPASAAVMRMQINGARSAREPASVNEGGVR